MVDRLMIAILSEEVVRQRATNCVIGTMIQI